MLPTLNERPSVSAVMRMETDVSPTARAIRSSSGQAACVERHELL